MIYPYMESSDGTQIAHSHLIEENSKQKIIVDFEKPTKRAFLLRDANCRDANGIWKMVFATEH